MMSLEYEILAAEFAKLQALYSQERDAHDRCGKALAAKYAEVVKLTEDLDLTTRALNLHEIELRRAHEEIVDLKGDLRVMDELLVQKDKKPPTTFAEDQEDSYYEDLVKRLNNVALYHGTQTRYRGASQEHHEHCETTAAAAAEDIVKLRSEIGRLKEREQEAWDILEFGIYMDDNDHYRCVSCTADLTKSGEVCHEGCKRAAWLAGCSE